MIPRALLRRDSASHEDMLTDAAVHVLADHGVVGLTTKAVAAWLRVTPARVSQMATREHLRLVVTWFANRLLDWIEQRYWSEGCSALLALEEENVVGPRVWLALCEWRRGRPELAEIFESARERERAVLRDLDLGLDDHELDLVLTTAEGLRARLCDPSRPLTPEQARSTLARLLQVLGTKTARAA
jgi:hypothetical protein